MTQIEIKPSYISGGIIALVGLVLVLVLPGIIPEWIRGLIVGAITGGFGVAAAGRIWPGLPLKQMPIYGIAVALYGALLGFLGSM